MDNNQKEVNKLIDLYFNQPKILYSHLFDTFHQFVDEIIPYLLTYEQNYFYENTDKEMIYLHGFSCSNIRIKPSVFDNDNEIKFPNDARRNHLNYFATIIADIVQYVEKINILTNEKTITNIGNIEKDLPIANIPIMVKSRFCSTNITKDNKDECKFDPGGYFIVNGQEKIVMSIEKMVDNKILVFSKKDLTYPDNLVYTAQINSKKNDWSDNLQILTIKNKKDGVLSVSTSLQLVDVPLFILMRALGIESDKNILSHITYNLEDDKMLNMLRPSIINSVDDLGNPIKTTEEAIEYLISKLKRNKRISQTDEALAKIQKKIYLEKIFRQDLLPHLEDDMPKKIAFLGFIANKILNVMLHRVEPDDRDSLQNKRIEPPGILLGQLFRQNWKKLLNEIGKHFKKKNQLDDNPINVINQIKPSTIEQGIKTALSTGIWGMNKTKKGVAQSLQRLSWIQGTSYLRRIVSPMIDESTAKVVSIRQVHPNQCQLLCCLTEDTEILLGNGMDIKLIKDILDNDSVISINHKELTENSTLICNKFNILPNKILKITTISGRILKMTEDHKLLVFINNKNDWIRADELKLDDKLVIRYIHKYYENILIECNEYNNLYRYDTYKTLLYKIARLYGYLYKLQEYKFTTNKHCDILYIYDDLISLGYNTTFITERELYFIYIIESKSLINSYCNLNTILPWVLNNSNLIKREFLAGYFGACNTDITIETGIIDEINNDDIILLLNNFNITVTDKYIINTQQNIINFADCIGIRYNFNKNYQLGLISEYYKIVILENYIGLYNEFINEYVKNKLITLPIKSIEENNIEQVYDFTTVSNNHSFIANSIVSSNCVETPEGAKIGIVKSLAMTASITTQNLIQKDIIINILNKIKHIQHPYDINPLDMNKYIKIFSNGNWLGVCKIIHSLEIYNELKELRYNNIINTYTSILFDYKNKEIRLYYDGGRLIRPLLIVKNASLNLTTEIIKDINHEYNLSDKNKSWTKLLNKHKKLIEFEDIESLNYLLIAESITKLIENLNNKNNISTNIDQPILNRYGDHRWLNYTHCDLHSWLMLGSVAINIPFSNHNYAVRNILHFSQAKQSIGIYLSSYKNRMDISQILYHPQIPLITTQGMKYNNCLDLPYGENVIVAILSYNGYNQEDSIIFNKSSVERGIFRADTLKKIHSEISKNPSTSQDDMFTKPDKNKVTSIKHGNYDKLNEYGYVPVETIMQTEDIIIGRISPIQPTGNNNKIFKDSSEIYKSFVPGVIDKVDTEIFNAEGYEMINVRIRQERKPVCGDKFTCYDDTHDILTSNGWINIKDINLQYKIASLVDNKLIYQYPNEIQKYDYNGKMYLLENNNISLCVTPSHRMWVKSEESKKYNIELSENILNKKRYYKKSIDEIIVEQNTNYFIYDNKNKIVYFKSFNNINNSIDTEYIYIKIKVWLLIFSKLFNKKNISHKYLPVWIWDMPMYLCKILFDNIINKYDFIVKNNKKIYIFNSKIIVNDIQRLCLHAGYTCNLKYINEDMYNLYIINSQDGFSVNEDIYEDKLIDFTGTVHCCSVPGEGIVYVRRNGKCVFSGNSLHGQKGTIGILYDQKDMPFTESGIIPDLILNPHGFPGRMSIAQFIECLASKQSAISGEFIDGTPFNNYDINQIPQALKKLGYAPYGTDVMYCGLTGKKMDVEIFIGPTYNIRLKHMVLDKVHGRARGPRQALTKQPLEGRSREGGLKIGEMEKDAMIAHGISQFLKERLMETSDQTKVYICDICGMFAAKVIDKEYYRCKGCHNSTKISAVVIPFACKLLFQELTSVNIVPRIRTEQSIYNNEI